MEKRTQNEGTRKAVNEYRAIVPTWRAPIVTGTVTRNGMLFYKGRNGKLYIPHLYDAMFKTVKGIILDKLPNGASPIIGN